MTDRICHLLPIVAARGPFSRVAVAAHVALVADFERWEKNQADVWQPETNAPFDTVRQMVLLVAGDKSGNWQGWYEVAIPLAEARYAEHLVALEEGG